MGMWNNLSDVKVEERVNDSLSVIKQDHFFKEVAEDGVDKEARWLKKGTKTYFG
ncbi:hypothetical protein ACILDU_00790 [Capnocytophaga canimorsus]|uniref:hypothetical protein n=1 Tax=Capnocytophaga canimorsus TaxID=28188 RepID=UPI0037CE832A